MRPLTACLGLLLAAAASASADDNVQGRALAATCTGCHGPNGTSVSDIPSLSGRPQAELAKLLRDYREGTRAGTVMPQHAKGYDDKQIECVASWFAAQSR